MIIIKSQNKTPKFNTVLNEIKYLREMQNFLIDRRNSNRYSVIVKEPSGHTAYCFSSPIYSLQTRKLVLPSFEKTPTGYFFRGSNGLISINKNRCVLETREGRVVIYLNHEPTIHQYMHDFKSQHNVVIAPTLNGIRFVITENEFTLQLKSETKQEDIRFNPSCFSIMREQFKPFLSIASLYAYDEEGNFSSVKMEYYDKGDQLYDISFSTDLPNGSFLFEVNIYEPKLFQDTTVESLHPEINNAYGAVSFVGKTKQFGEQWLYSRPDFSKISDLDLERIENVFLHIPIFNSSYENVDVFIPENRFCSFGSTWNNKINASPKIASSTNRGRYLTIDVTPAFTNRIDRTLVYNEGLILKKPKGKNNFIAISTGDCYSAPQILEIKFKN